MITIRKTLSATALMMINMIFWKQKTKKLLLFLLFPTGLSVSSMAHHFNRASTPHDAHADNAFWVIGA